MKKKLIALSIIIVVFASGCSAARSDEGNRTDRSSGAAASAIASAVPSASATGNRSAAESSPSASPASANEDKTTEVKALHLRLRIPADWTLQSGEDSYGFQKDGVPVGGLDGLGYADSEAIDSLLPNGAVVDKQEKLEGFPVPVIRAQLTLEGRGDEGKREEIHYYYFLKDEKAIYDLRFDAEQVEPEQSDRIAKTAEAG